MIGYGKDDNHDTYNRDANHQDSVIFTNFALELLGRKNTWKFDNKLSVHPPGLTELTQPGKYKQQLSINFPLSLFKCLD